MSNLTNQKLLEEAAFYIDYFEGTLLGRVLESMVEADDLESLHQQVQLARVTAFDLEYRPDELVRGEA